MTGRITTSPRLLARITGVFFLLTILGGIFAQGFVSEKLINFGDAAATANNILTNKGLFQLGFAVYLIEMACQIAMTALFYVLLRPVSRSVSLLSAFWGLTGCVIKSFARVFYIVPLFVLGGAPSLSAFSTEQLQSMAIVLLKINDVGAGIALAFFGFSTVLKGWLIFRSTFLPRWLGILSMVSGLGWVAFLYPPLGYRAFPFIALIGLIGSAASIFWLLVFGVDEERWKEQTASL
jgi:hypothetical protein